MDLPKAGVNLDFMSQWGYPIGLALGGLLPMIRGNQNPQSKVAPPAIPGPFNQMAASAQTAPAAAAAPPPIPPPMGIPAAPGAAQGAPPIPPAMGVPPAASAAGGVNPGAAGTGEVNMSDIVQKAMTALGGLGGLGGMAGAGSGAAGAGGAGNANAQLSPAIQSALARSQFAPVSYAGTGANPQVMQMYQNAALGQNQFGGPAGPAGMNPFLAMMARRMYG